MDVNGNGLVTLDEMENGIQEFSKSAGLKLTKADAIKLFEAMDVN